MYKEARKNLHAFLPDVTTAPGNLLSLYNVSKLRSPEGTSINGVRCVWAFLDLPNLVRSSSSTYLPKYQFAKYLPYPKV